MRVHELARHVEEATKIGIVHLFLDACFEDGQVKDVFHRAQSEVGAAQQLAQAFFIVDIDLSNQKFAAIK